MYTFHKQLQFYVCCATSSATVQQRNNSKSNIRPTACCNKCLVLTAGYMYLPIFGLVLIMHQCSVSYWLSFCFGRPGVRGDLAGRTLCRFIFGGLNHYQMFFFSCWLALKCYSSQRDGLHYDVLSK